MWVDCKQFLKMHFKNSAVSEVPVLLIFLELKTETEVPSYLRPHNVKKSGKWKLNKVYIWCLRYSFEFFLKTGVGVCKPCVVFSLSRPTNQSLQHCQWEPLPPKSWRVWLFPGWGESPCSRRHHQSWHSWWNNAWPGVRNTSDLICAPFSRCERMWAAQWRVRWSLLWKCGRVLPVRVRWWKPGVQPHDRTVPLPALHR